MMKKIYLVLLIFIPITFISAQNTDPDCQLLCNPGKHNVEMRVYQWAADVAVSVKNPSTAGLAIDTVLKWQKGGGWGGIGALNNDSTQLFNLKKYKYLTVWIYPTEDTTQFVRAEYKNRYYKDHPKNVIGENNFYVVLPPNKWSKVKFDLDDVLQFADDKDTNTFHISSLNIQPDGTNDIQTWIRNYYYFGPIHLESATGCASTGINDYTILSPEKIFTFNNNTVYFTEPGIKNLVVYSILGNKILDIKNPSGSIKIPSTNSGVFVIQVTTIDNKFETRKVFLK